jgi:hypothetical protein
MALSLKKNNYLTPKGRTSPMGAKPVLGSIA